MQTTFVAKRIADPCAISTSPLASEIPVVAIGGIDAGNAAACIAAGALGVAVVSAIFRDGETVAPDAVRARASRLRAVIESAGRHA